MFVCVRVCVCVSQLHAQAVSAATHGRRSGGIAEELRESVLKKAEHRLRRHGQ